MWILALDSTATAASVAICRDDKAIAAFHLNNGNTHSETLLPMVDAALRVAGLSIDDIDLLACSNGPGSFTGVRIGAATIKGLAFDKNKPVIGVSTLEALAENAVPAPDGTLIVPVMNARRGQLYNAIFRAEGDTAVRITPDRAIAATELEKELLDRGRPVYLVGDGVAEMLRLTAGTTPLPLTPLAIEQNAVSVAKCARRHCLAGEGSTDAALSPVYLRLPQAERERLERMQKN